MLICCEMAIRLAYINDGTTILIRRCAFFPSSNSGGGIRKFSSAYDSTRAEFAGENAYDILGVSETSSSADIKASFRKLAKETHPDLAESNSDSKASSLRFIRISAAYQILSDSVRRAHYDSYLLSQRKIVQRQSSSGQGSRLHTYYNSYWSEAREMEVVEWLSWYRSAINDILAERRVAVGTGYFDDLEADFYSAIHAAFYGPGIDSMDLLPDRFEAEERSVYETLEVLHLVSGRDVFGMVSIVNDVPELSPSFTEKLGPAFGSLELHPSFENVRSNTDVNGDVRYSSDVYKDLELHVCGSLVAVASRIPPKIQNHARQDEDPEDEIHVYLCSKEDSTPVSGSRTPLGTITGLGTSPDEGSCFVYDSRGKKTHVIMKHRTFMVKHMHWYTLGDDVSVCECRCSRARLPPSKFWLFEPRCGMHDIGGWYVETFGRDKKGLTVTSQRYWDGCDGSEPYDKRLHPAMYLLALAYRTLDIEHAKRNKRRMTDVVGNQLLRALQWCKKFA
ncbi:DnaJ homolog subfamily C member 16 [Linum perenne]